MRHLDDLTLLSAVLGRDEQAWNELVRRFRGLIYHCIGVALKRYEGALPTEEIDEIFCEVCVNLLRNEMGKLRSYDPQRGTKLGTWIGLISIRTCYDHLRAASRRPLLDGGEGVPEQADGEPSALELLLDCERRRHLERLVADLTPRERSFFDLYYRQGLDPMEVAQAMNVSVGTIYAKKNKLKARLIALAGESLALAA
jgi:RNA polymerase sigma-70 factor (ECF subfamily)